MTLGCSFVDGLGPNIVDGWSRYRDTQKQYRWSCLRAKDMQVQIGTGMSAGVASALASTRIDSLLPPGTHVARESSP